MNSRPWAGVAPIPGCAGNVSTTPTRMIAKKNSNGMPILASFSIPPEMPRERT
jgi:hypothetical protein